MLSVPCNKPYDESN